MSNVVLRRINQQINPPPQPSTVVEAPTHVVDKKLPTPLSSEEIRKIFMPEPEVATPSEEQVFDGIEAFVSWYLPVRDKFSEAQNMALITLVQMRDYINSGCACKRDYRLGQANDYYKAFWDGNRETDLPQKVKEVGNFKSVLFCFKAFHILQVS
jgi:hypothetical protein